MKQYLLCLLFFLPLFSYSMNQENRLENVVRNQCAQDNFPALESKIKSEETPYITLSTSFVCDPKKSTLTQLSHEQQYLYAALLSHLTTSQTTKFPTFPKNQILLTPTTTCTILPYINDTTIFEFVSKNNRHDLALFYCIALK